MCLWTTFEKLEIANNHVNIIIYIFLSKEYTCESSQTFSYMSTLLLETWLSVCFVFCISPKTRNLINLSLIHHFCFLIYLKLLASQLFMYPFSLHGITNNDKWFKITWNTLYVVLSLFIYKRWNCCSTHKNTFTKIKLI